MPFGRKTVTLLIALAVIGAPALALRVLCVGHSCDDPAEASTNVPFCSLPPDTRQLLSEGFREGRSPEVLAVTRHEGVAGITGTESPIPWPALDDHAETRVPLGFSGTGVDPAAEVPPGTTLDSVAPTAAAILGFERPFPEVRSGEAIPGIATQERPRLVIEIVARGLGSDDLGGAWPNLTRLLDAGPSTLDAGTGSLPTDPAAILTTIGSGGPPRQHGITGSHVRNDHGALVRAFSDRGPAPVIATLADDLDEELGQRPLIGLVAPASTDRGAIGGRWYPGADYDDVVIAKRGQVEAARGLLDGGYGADAVPDVLVVVLNGSEPKQDGGLPRLIDAARKAARGSLTVVVTATGSLADRVEFRAAEIAAAVEDGVESRSGIVEAAVAGGLFVDQGVLARDELSEDAIVQALNDLDDRGGAALFGDTFSAIAVSFARYC